jgi:putative FmdB family regulatory protein
MPTYAYACPKCGHEYDKLQKFSDETRAKCPECGTRGERLITGGTGFVFKGSGFYETDYKRAGERKGEADGDGASKDKDKDKSKDKGKGKDKSTDGKSKKKSPSGESSSSSGSEKGKGAES